MFLSTANISELYDVDAEFFLRRKRSGEFIKNVHYVEKGKTLRWNISEVKKWWFGEEVLDNETEVLLERLFA